MHTMPTSLTVNGPTDKAAPPRPDGPFTGERLLAHRPEHAASDELPLGAGDIIFHVTKRLGEGGQGRVLLVTPDASPSKRYALKAFRSPQDARDEWAMLKAMANERVTPQPHTLGLTWGIAEPSLRQPSYGDAPAWCIVMEFIDGTRLSVLAQEALLAGRPLSLEAVLAHLAPIVRLCAHAADTRHPVAHKDIKPDNVLIEQTGARARLVDFGMAYGSPEPMAHSEENEDAAGGARSEKSENEVRANNLAKAVGARFGAARGATASPKHGGTAGFAAPELFGRGQGDIADLRVDTYGICATAAYLAMRRLPHDGMELVALLRPGSVASIQSQNIPGASHPAAQNASFDAPRLYHDASTWDSVALQTISKLTSSFGVRADEAEAVAPRATHLGLEAVDIAVLQALESGLSTRQADRPTPDALARMLPTDLASFRARAVAEAVPQALRLLAAAPANERAVANTKGRPAQRHAKFPEGNFGPDALPGQTAAQQTAAPSPVPSPDWSRGATFTRALNDFNSGRYEAAVPVLEAEAARGNGSAKYYLAVCLRDGLGAAPDPERVASLLADAAADGNVMAMNALGVMLVEGVGVPRNVERGLAWVRKAASDEGKTGLPIAKNYLLNWENSAQDSVREP